MNTLRLRLVLSNDGPDDVIDTRLHIDGAKLSGALLADGRFVAATENTLSLSQLVTNTTVDATLHIVQNGQPIHMTFDVNATPAIIPSHVPATNGQTHTTTVNKIVPSQNVNADVVARISPISETIVSNHASASNMLGQKERLLLAQLMRIKPSTRAMHALALGLFMAPDSSIGQSLRQNIIVALGRSANDNAPNSAWVLMPAKICREIKPDADLTEIQGIVYVAEWLAEQDLDVATQSYFLSIATSFRSLAGLDDQSARKRIFSTAKSLDDKLASLLPTS